MERYSRHISLSEIGEKGQEKLSKAKILVIGAGGLGCPVLQYLTAAGVGTIGIVDFDVVEVSNLQRQILFGSSSLGKNKALAAKASLENLNDSIIIHTYTEALTAKNSSSIFEAYDIIVDGTDNFPTRYLINDTAILTNKPVVYGAIYKYDGQVSVFNYENGPSYRCLFPKPPEPKTIPNCSETGVLGVLPGIIGSLQANEVLKLILGIGKPLSGTVYFFNTLSNVSYAIQLERNPLEISKVKQRGVDFDINFETLQCASEVKEIELNEIDNFETVQFIDVREPHELPKLVSSNLIQIPLSQLEANLDVINTEKRTVMVCQSGIRSKKAVALVQQHNLINCVSLKVGACALANALKP